MPSIGTDTMGCQGPYGSIDISFGIVPSHTHAAGTIRDASFSCAISDITHHHPLPAIYMNSKKSDGSYDTTKSVWKASSSDNANVQLMPIRREGIGGSSTSGAVKWASGDGYVATYAMGNSTQTNPVSYADLETGGYDVLGQPESPMIYPLNTSSVAGPDSNLSIAGQIHKIGMTGPNWGQGINDTNTYSGAYPTESGVNNTNITVGSGSWMNLDISGTSDKEVNYTDPVGTSNPKDPPVYTNLANAIDMGKVFPPADDPLSSQTNLGYKTVGVYFIIYYPKVI
jgi:hypothetical protein